MQRSENRQMPFGSAAVMLLAAMPLAQAEGTLEILLPLGRTAYQTNEDIHLAVVRSSDKALRAGEMRLLLAGPGGSRMSFAFAVPAIAVVGADARATEHIYLNGRLLRPGHYTIEAGADGVAARTDIDVYGHVRRTSYKLIPWGRAKGKQQLVEGEDSLGFNLFYGVYATDDEGNLIRAGLDFMRCCAMGGAHQMDLRSECDWSDPYVTRGGAVRVVQRTLTDRTRPNTAGVHFYDEPGLTHLKHPVTGEQTPHGIPSQHRSYEAAFGRKPPAYHTLDPRNPDHVARWRHFARWKLGFMDAAWKIAQFGVSYARPDYLSVTQSQYGFGAFTDGYYFNVVRCLPITSGHGGYHDYGLYLFNPSYFLETALARDHAKPCWYLPCWYSSTTYEQFRLEQNLCFAMGIQGLQTPPDIDPFEPAKKLAAEAVVETNKIAARLGPIFHTMPPTYPPVAVLYSLSHMIHKQTLDRSVNYLHQDDHGAMLPWVYLAGTMLHHRFLTVVEEDALDGTLIARHKALILASIDYLPPAVVWALENFIEYGGLVLMTGGCGVKVKGAVDLGLTPKLPDEKLIEELRKKNDEESRQRLRALTTLGKQLAAARPLAEAIDKQLRRRGIRPIFECDNAGIVATRHAAGDVEYLFAVNASTDRAGESHNTQAAVATIWLPVEPGDRRPIYDAVRGGPAWEFARKDGKLVGRFRFGPGQMRVFARPLALPTGVVVTAPVVRREYTRHDAPLVVDVGATVTGAGGSLPLRVRVFDPLGKRHDVYRATELGTLRLSLPLGVNDPPGTWAVYVQNLLTNHEGTATFEHYAPPRCGALAGRKTRAIHFGRDRDNIFRFFRVHRGVTIVTGSSDYNQPAAKRLAKILQPWDVKCTVVKAADVNKPRRIPAEALKTWIGLSPTRLSEKNPGRPDQVGFAVEGPVVLLGTARDNPLIAYLLKRGFLPYEPKADVFPGRGRGLLAWQRDGVGHGQESITVIADDAGGMAEAVGTLYEAQAGMEPLTRWELPKASHVAAATKADVPPEPRVAWSALLPDRAVGMKADGDTLTVLTRDESISTIDAKGEASAPRPMKADAYARQAERMKPTPDAEAMKLAREHPVPGRIAKHAVRRGDRVAVGYWGGLLRILDADGSPKAACHLQHDITFLSWPGETLAVGLSDGRVVGLSLGAVRAPAGDTSTSPASRRRRTRSAVRRSR